MPSLLGTIVCMICLMGTTWAWFADNVTTSIQSIKAASYSINVDINDGEKLEDGTYSLSQKTEGEGYQVTVKANGSASTGYFRVSGPEGFLPLYSTQLAPGEGMTFTFYPSTTGEYYFESAWGKYSGGNPIKDSDIIGTPKPSDENIVDKEELEKNEISNDPADSRPAHKPNKEENINGDVNEDVNEGSGEELNNDVDGELDNIPSTVQPSEAPDDTEETLPPHISNEDSNLEESVEQPTVEMTEETIGNAVQNQE